MNSWSYEGRPPTTASQSLEKYYSKKFPFSDSLFLFKCIYTTLKHFFFSSCHKQLDNSWLCQQKSWDCKQNDLRENTHLCLLCCFSILLSWSCHHLPSFLQQEGLSPGISALRYFTMNAGEMLPKKAVYLQLQRPSVDRTEKLDACVALGIL